MSEIRIAAPNRSEKWLSTLPGTPDRPSSSVPRESRCATTPVGVRASVQSTATRRWPWRTSERVSPTRLVPRSRSTTVPSALKTSSASTQVVIPGRVESIAVSSVQSAKDPFGSSQRRFGRRSARTAGVTVGLSAAPSADPPPAALAPGATRSVPIRSAICCARVIGSHGRWRATTVVVRYSTGDARTPRLMGMARQSTGRPVPASRSVHSRISSVTPVRPSAHRAWGRG